MSGHEIDATERLSRLHEATVQRIGEEESLEVTSETLSAEAGRVTIDFGYRESEGHRGVRIRFSLPKREASFNALDERGQPTGAVPNAMDLEDGYRIRLEAVQSMDGRRPSTPASEFGGAAEAADALVQGAVRMLPEDEGKDSEQR